MMALYKGFLVSAILSAILLYFITDHVVGLNSVLTDLGEGITGMSLFYCGLLGLIITGLIIWVTEYYTGTNYRPVQSIAQASTTGHGTNVIQGLAISLEATALPALIIVAGIISTYSLGGLFGIAIAVQLC
jgi:K(+)-stimulated pyrophosphate-energized sodium pump